MCTFGLTENSDIPQIVTVTQQQHCTTVQNYIYIYIL